MNSLSEKLALQSRRAVFETDEEKDTLNALKMFKYFYFNIETDQYFYKWAIIALHNALQGFMVLALRGTNGVNVYNEESREALLQHFDYDEKINKKLRMESFLKLYAKLKSSDMKIWGTSQLFVPKGSEDKSVKKLNDIRNDFIHFSPKTWVIYLHEMNLILSDCIKIIKYSVYECGNIVWRSEVYKQECRTTLAELLNEGL